MPHSGHHSHSTRQLPATRHSHQHKPTHTHAPRKHNPQPNTPGTTRPNTLHHSPEPPQQRHPPKPNNPHTNTKPPNRKPNNHAPTRDHQPAQTARNHNTTNPTRKIHQDKNHSNTRSRKHNPSNNSVPGESQITPPNTKKTERPPGITVEVSTPCSRFYACSRRGLIYRWSLPIDLYHIIIGSIWVHSLLSAHTHRDVR